MRILITSGVGEGKTELSAFDKALEEAGISNLNLIKLSSIIPKEAVIFEEKPNIPEKFYGCKGYVVLSKAIATTPHQEAWAGIGWVYDYTERKGFFVEHAAATEEKVKSLIKKSVESMKEWRKEAKFKPSYKLAGAVCNENPVCAIVCAFYCIEDWDNNLYYL